jgi:FG-GAP-like repeat/FG-GAP repeat
MFSFSARQSAARLAVFLPAVILASCGGSNLGAIVTVPNWVVVADLNSDGVPDVAVVAAQIDETGLTQKPGLLGVELNSKATPGQFGVGANLPTSAAPPSGLAVGDLSGTGTHDLVVSNLNAGTLSVFMETSPTSGAYGKATTITVGGGPNDVQIADLNGDGLPDLIVADNTGKVTYLLQTPGTPGTFQAAVSLPITNRAISVAVGDLNGDGLPDLAVTSFDGSGDFGLVTIYFQDPAHAGTFLATPTTIPAYGEPSQILIRDLNQDGVNDIVVACQGLGGNADANAATDGETVVPVDVALAETRYGAMVILQNSGTPGSFATPLVYIGAQGTIALAVGDLNGDGVPDIAMVSPYPQGGGGTIITLMQDPTTPGTFLLPINYTGQGQPVSVAIGDLDNDGLPDLVTADGTSAFWYKNIPASSTSVQGFAVQAQIGTFQ